MGNKWDHIFNRLKWVIAVAAYLFLIYKLATFKDYDAVKALLENSAWTNVFWLLGGIALLPLNILLESLKWKQLISPLYPSTLKESIRMVLWGNTGGFSTPNRIGEFPTRSMLMPEGTRAQSIALGFVGSLAQTICIFVCGSLGFYYFYKTFSEGNFENSHNIIYIQWDIIIGYVAISVLLIALFITLPYWVQRIKKSNNKTLQQLNRIATDISYGYQLKIFLLAAARYLTFCLQSYCMYRFCLVDISVREALIAIPTFYLFVTLTPSINISEMAVRGSYAALVFSCFTPNYFGAIVASFLTWLINYCIPMMLGSLFVKFGHK